MRTRLPFLCSARDGNFNDFVAKKFDREISFLFEKISEDYSCCGETKKLCAAVSGGADSMAMLLLLHSWCAKNDAQLFCVTVDHRLRENSLEEAQFVASICDQLKVPHKILSWNHDNNFSHSKLENLAREARYALIENFCEEHEIPFICVAHNWNDQLETFEMRLDSGSEFFGLAGMSRVRSLSPSLKFLPHNFHKKYILRPIMQFFKSELKTFLRNFDVSWKEDPMNYDTSFKRVKYRQLIESYDEKIIQKKTQQILEFGQKRRTIEIYAVNFLKNHIEFSPYGFVNIDKEKFGHMPDNIQAEILKRVIWDIGGKKYASSIGTQLVAKILRKNINTIGRCLIKISKHRISIFRENRNIPNIRHDDVVQKILWDNRFLIDYSQKSVREKKASTPSSVPLAALKTFPGDQLEESRRITFIHKANLFDIFL